ncbi:unnamed protein product [Diamesa tonsa]
MNKFIWILFVVNLIQIVTCENDNIFEGKKQELQESYNNTKGNQGNNQRNKGTYLNIPKTKNAGTNLNNRTINQQGNVGQGQKPINQQSNKLNIGNQQNKGPGSQLNVGQGNSTNGQKKNPNSGGQGSTQGGKMKLNLWNGNQTIEGGNQRNPQGTKKDNGQGPKLNQGKGNQTQGSILNPNLNQWNTTQISQPTEGQGPLQNPGAGNGKSLQELLQEFPTTRFSEVPIKLATVTGQPYFNSMEEQITEKSIKAQTVSQKKSSEDKVKKNSKN